MTTTNFSNFSLSNTELFAQLLAAQDIKPVPSPNSLVEGTVVAITKAGAWVNYGGKFDALVLPDELNGENGGMLVVDSVHLFLVTGEQDENGHLSLSLNAALAWTAAQSSFSKGETVMVTVTAVARRRGETHINGLRVKLGELPGFIPRSKLLAANHALDALVGTQVSAKIVELSLEERKLVLDHAQVARAEQTALREELLSTLKPGTIVLGTIGRLAVKEGQEYGFFVELGAGVSGLLHRSEIAGSSQKPLLEVLKLGSQVELKLTSISLAGEKPRISLSHKGALRDTILSSLTVDTALTVTVVRIVDFGCFVEIVPGVDALLHKNCFSPAMRRANGSPKVGDTINAFVESVDPKSGRIGVTALNAA